jgi:hypothetical protein
MKRNEMKKWMLVSIIAMFIAAVTYGDTIPGWMWWDGEGADDLWTTDDNWRRTDGQYPDNTAPNADCNVSVGFFSTYSPAYAQITEGMDITIYGFNIGLGSAADGVIDMTGGTLNSYYMNNTMNDTSATAVLNLYGGTINVTTSIGVARDGTGTINVEGGIINCNLVMMALNSTGVGTINLNGGELVVDYDTANPDQDNLQIRDGSKFVISDGVLKYNTGGLLTVADFEAFADAGKILADTSVDPLNEINIDTVGDYIVVTAVPEPATMLLLGLGGLVLRKRRS